MKNILVYKVIALLSLFLGFASCKPKDLPETFAELIIDKPIWEVHNILVYNNSRSLVYPEYRGVEYRNCGELHFNSGGDGVFSFGSLESYQFTYEASYDNGASTLKIIYSDPLELLVSGSEYIRLISHYNYFQGDGWIERELEWQLKNFRIISISETFIMLEIDADNLYEIYLTPVD
ncbi:hypothetical protein [Parvicella tangerina]|uniref:Uncharacterized protein n=1 Tax=Parvicella tangerina TaxID=2829795 RepID=A0A916JKL8_9FLAO|nr:hypothetical protein [Parvicella tangerina]CAG5077125.1 hypothetical protein CRYO30217_00297 [Parvicella tangerina]